MPPSLGLLVGSGHLGPFRLGAPNRPSFSRSASQWGSTPSVAPSLEGNRPKPSTSQREGADQGFAVGTVRDSQRRTHLSMTAQSVSLWARWPRGVGGECPGAHSGGLHTQEWIFSRPGTECLRSKCQQGQLPPEPLRRVLPATSSSWGLRSPWAVAASLPGPASVFM